MLRIIHRIYLSIYLYVYMLCIHIYIYYIYLYVYISLYHIYTLTFPHTKGTFCRIHKLKRFPVII